MNSVGSFTTLAARQYPKSFFRAYLRIFGVSFYHALKILLSLLKTMISSSLSNNERLKFGIDEILTEGINL
jgi:hypothetical protein